MLTGNFVNLIYTYTSHRKKTHNQSINSRSGGCRHL